MAATAIDTLVTTISAKTTTDTLVDAFLTGLITAITAAIVSDAGIANTAITVVRDRLTVNKANLQASLSGRLDSKWVALTS